jgi:hypothetical protein
MIIWAKFSLQGNMKAHGRVEVKFHIFLKLAQGEDE